MSIGSGARESGQLNKASSTTGTQLLKPASSVKGLRIPKPSPTRTTQDKNDSDFVLSRVVYNPPKNGKKEDRPILKTTNPLFEYMNQIGVPIAAQPALMALFSQAAELAIAGKLFPTLADDTVAYRHPLPPLPDGLTWPHPRRAEVPASDRTDDDFDQAPECGKWGGLERYLRRVWEPLIPYIDMPTMREHWPAAAAAIKRQRSKLPKELLPAVQTEVTDRIAAAIPERRDRPWHVEKALQMRDYRARKKLEK